MSSPAGAEYGGPPVTEITVASDPLSGPPPEPGAGPPAEAGTGPRAETGAGHPRKQLRWPKTLAGRLVLGVVALFLVVVTITGATTYFLLKPFLLQRLDQQLGSFATGNASSVHDCILTGGRGCTVGTQSINGGAQLATQKEWISGYESTGASVISVTGNLPALAALNLTISQRNAVIANPGKSRTIVTSDNLRLRITGRQFQFQGQPITVVTGLSIDEVDHTLSRLLGLEVGVGLGAMVLVGLLTNWGVRAGLRPLRRVTRTAQEVTAELGPDGSGLDRRVPDADPGTEVGQVASSVNTLLHAVQTEFAARVRSEERMRQFLADASHELRTPLTSIRGYAELSRLQGQSGEAADDSMRRIEVEGTRMSRLVEDLLVLARGDQGSAMRREPVEVDELLAEAADVVHSAHPERDISTVGSGGIVVVGDWDQLLRVLINLATNAAIHTPAPGPIRIEALAVRTQLGNSVALRVVDSGPGLPAEDAAHVFERFWRADKARTRTKGGSGLGMAIVAQIVQAHGGTVHFESSVQAGTTVTVILPLPQLAGYPPAPYPPAPSLGSGPAGLPAAAPPPPAGYPAEWGTRQN